MNIDMAHKWKKSIGIIASNLFAIIFPWVSGGFLCTVSGFLKNIKRADSNGFFYMVYVIYLLMFALFLYVLLCKGKSILMVCDMVGIISVILFHIQTILKMLPNNVYISIFDAFPYNYFLMEILGIVYLLNAFSVYLNKRV